MNQLYERLEKLEEEIQEEMELGAELEALMTAPVRFDRNKPVARYKMRF